MQNNVDFGSKPKFLMCFVCGREFSKGSLEIHFYQCQKKAEIESNREIETPNEYLIFFEKVKTNQKMLFSEIEDFNEFSNKLFKFKTMAACPFCNRRFLKDRLEVHLRSCKPKDGNFANAKANSTLNNIGGDNNRNSKLLDGNLIKNLNNAKSVEKIDLNGVGSSSNANKNLNMNKSGNFNFKNIKIVDGNKDEEKYELNKSNKEMFNDENKFDINLLNTKEETCPNCEEKMNISKLPLHLKKCPGKKRNFSQNKFSMGSTNAKFNPRSSYTGSDNNNLKSRMSSKPKVFSSEKKPESQTTSKAFGASAAEKQKPCFLSCYICGREFGKTSLEIHLKTCKIKFLNSEDISPITTTSTNFKKTNNNKTNLPEPPNILYELLDKINSGQEPSFQEISEYNQLAEKIYKEKSLKACIGCKRTFVKESLEVHLKSCKQALKAQESEPSHMKITQRPRMLMCPLCGREFGTLSLEIHIKTCCKKFDLEQETMPLNLRRSADAILEKYYSNLNRKEEAVGAASRGSKGAFNIDELNDQAYEIYSKEALVPCENCGRTFLPDRLLVHLRSCKGKRESKVDAGARNKK